MWTTALTVDEALKQLSMSDAAPAAASRASRLPLAGMALPVVSAKHVHINDGGVASDQRLAAPTVGQLLAAAGAPLQQDDKVVPPASTPVIEGMQIVVTRIRAHNVAARMPLPAPLRRIQDPTMNISRHVVVDPGTTRHPGRHLRRLDRQRRRNRPTAGGPRCRYTRPAVGTAGRCQAGHPGAAGEQRRHVGRARLLRVQRQLGHQHRQRLLWRRAVQPEHLEAPRWTALRAARRPRHPRRADRNRRGHSGAAGLGRLAGMQRQSAGALTIRLLRRNAASPNTVGAVRRCPK